MAHVTSVDSGPSGLRVNTVGLRALTGLENRRSIATWRPAEASTISIEPAPAARFPDHSYLAPTPRSGPLYVRLRSASTFSQGDQFSQAWKSSSYANTAGAGASSTAERESVTSVDMAGSSAAVTDVNV